MPGISIRDAAPEDAEPIARLVTELGYPTSIAQMRRRLEAIAGDDDYTTFVACDGDEVVGFVGTRLGPLYEDDGPYAQVMALAVAGDHRRRGVGHRLLLVAEHHLRERGATAFKVVSGNHRTDAHAFYEHCGYAFTGRRYSKPASRPDKKVSYTRGAMHSIDLIRDNLEKSRDRVLGRIEEMRGHAIVFPTPSGGAHTLWVIGHLAYIESLVIRAFMLGGTNPLAHWEKVFDGEDVSGDLELFPPFDEALAECREVRASTLALLDTLSEADLDKPSAKVPKGYEETFGTWRLCLQYASDHWYMHRGQLADARRAAGVRRIWV